MNFCSAVRLPNASACASAAPFPFVLRFLDAGSAATGAAAAAGASSWSPALRFLPFAAAGAVDDADEAAAGMGIGMDKAPPSFPRIFSWSCHLLQAQRQGKEWSCFCVVHYRSDEKPLMLLSGSASPFHFLLKKQSKWCHCCPCSALRDIVSTAATNAPEAFCRQSGASPPAAPLAPRPSRCCPCMSGIRRARTGRPSVKFTDAIHDVTLLYSTWYPKSVVLITAVRWQK